MKSISIIAALFVTAGLAQTTPPPPPTDTTPIVFSLKNGWNMISSPVNGKKIDVSVLKSNGVTAVYSFNPSINNYETASHIEPGVGYWALCAKETNISAAEAFVSNASSPTIQESVAGAYPLAWNILGAQENTTRTAVKNMGATSVWWYDPQLLNYSTDEAISAGSGFWFKKGSTQFAATDSIQPLAAAIFAAAQGAKTTGGAAEKSTSVSTSTSTSLSGSLGSASTNVSLVPKSIRDAQFDAMKAGLTAALASLPEPYKTTYANKLNAASTLADLSQISTELTALQSSLSSGTTTTTGTTVQPIPLTTEQKAQLDLLIAYMDTQTKASYEALKAGTLTDKTKLLAFEAGVRNAGLKKAQEQMDAANKANGTAFGENNELEMNSSVNGFAVQIKMALYRADGTKIRENINKVESWVNYDSNGSNIAPLANLIKNGQPDFSLIKTRLRVSAPNGVQVSGGKVQIKFMESDLLPMPTGAGDLPQKILFHSEGNVTSQTGLTWNQRNMRTNIYPKEPGRMDGTYEINEKSPDGSLYKGTATFDSSGCKGADITKNGESIGKIILVEGKLYIEDKNGTRTELKSFDAL